LLPALSALLLLYTIEQLLNGERGVVTWKHLTQQVQQLTLENNQLHADVAELESNTARLRPDAHKHLDEDYVDELIRRHLPLVKPGERVMLEGKSPAAIP
jgi:cell division protein FtsB